MSATSSTGPGSAVFPLAYHGIVRGTNFNSRRHSQCTYSSSTKPPQNFLVPSCLGFRDQRNHVHRHRNSLGVVLHHPHSLSKVGQVDCSSSNSHRSRSFDGHRLSVDAPCFQSDSRRHSVSSCIKVIAPTPGNVSSNSLEWQVFFTSTTSAQKTFKACTDILKFFENIGIKPFHISKLSLALKR